MEQSRENQFFLTLIREQELRGMLGLGKIADPSTGEPTMNLDLTAYSIGVLETLEEKTRGNLSRMEEQELRRVLTTLRLNYVEEAKKASEQAPQGSEKSPKASGEGSPPKTAEEASGASEEAPPKTAGEASEASEEA